MTYTKPTSIWVKIPQLLPALFNCITRKLTARQAADELSQIAGQPMSRNSVISQASRKGVHFLGAEKTAKPKREVPYNIQRRKLPSIPIPDEPVMQADFLCVSFADLAPGQCKFPHGDDPLTMTYCGQPAEGPWCKYHHSICTVKGRNQWPQGSSSTFKMTA